MYELIFNGHPIRKGTVPELFGYLKSCLGDVPVERLLKFYTIQPSEINHERH